MSTQPGPASGLQNFNTTPGQNRESGGSESERTPFAAGEDAADSNPNTGS